MRKTDLDRKRSNLANIEIQDLKILCSCPTSQNIRLARDTNVDVSLDDYL